MKWMMLLNLCVWANQVNFDLYLQDTTKSATEKKYLIKAEFTEDDLKLWDELSLRYNLDGFDAKEHNFQIRLSPMNYGQRAVENKLRSLQKAELLFKKNKLYQNEYFKKLNRALDWVRFDLKKEELEKKQELFLARETYIKENINSGSVSATFVFATKKRNMQQNLEILDLQRNEKSLKEKLELETEGRFSSLKISTEHWLQADKLESWLNNNELDVEQVQNFELQKALLNKELKDEKTSQWIDHLNFGYKLKVPKYKEDPIDVGKEYWSAGITLNLPFLNGSASEKREGAMKAEIAEFEQSEKKINKERKLQKAKEELHQELLEYRALEKFQKESKQGEWQKIVTQALVDQPEELLKLKEDELEEYYDLKKKYLKILKDYLDYVEIATDANPKLLKNWLEVVP